MMGVTYTRRQILDMIPEYLAKVGPLAGGATEMFAGRLGIPRMALTALFSGWVLREGDVLTRARSSERSPYIVNWAQRDEQWRLLRGAGLAEEVPQGWRITPRGTEAVMEQQRIVRSALRGLALPADAARSAAGDLSRLASRIPPDAPRASWMRRRPGPGPDEPRSDAVTMTLDAGELWAFRDDCHIAAWRAKGYDGPVFDVLSFVWSSPPDVIWTKMGGHGTIEDLSKALEQRQGRADVERNVDELARRGDLARDGDAVSITPQGQRSRDSIEEDTDRRYFAIWDLDDAATARLGDDLRTVIDALPRA